jgi:hypothetical protein
MNFILRLIRLLLDNGPLVEKVPNIAAPRYRCLLTGEDFSRYDPALQERARQRREAADALRTKANRTQGGTAPPIREAKRA